MVIKISEKLRRLIIQCISALPVFLSVLGIILITTILLTFPSSQLHTLSGVNITSNMISPFDSKVQLMIEELQLNRSDLEKLKKQFETIMKLNAVTPTIDQEKINAQIENITCKLDGLEGAILEDPQKALAIPMLRNDLDNYKKNTDNQIYNVNKQIERIHDQSKLYIGLMVTMILGLFSVAACNFWQIWQQNKKQPASTSSSRGIIK